MGGQQHGDVSVALRRRGDPLGSGTHLGCRCGLRGGQSAGGARGRGSWQAACDEAHAGCSADWASVSVMFRVLVTFTADCMRAVPVSGTAWRGVLMGRQRVLARIVIVADAAGGFHSGGGRGGWHLCPQWGSGQVSTRAVEAALCNVMRSFVPCVSPTLGGPPCV